MSSDTENELYAILRAELRHQLKQYEQSMTVPEGAKLIDHGILQEYLMILNSGTVRISIPCPKQPVSFVTRQKGKVFGMRAIISGELPEIDVTCVDSCDVTVIPRTAFLGLLKSYPELYFAVAKVLSADLQMADRILRDHCFRNGHAPRLKTPRLV